MNKGNHPNRDQSPKDLPGQENRQAFGSEELNTNKGSRDLNQVHDTRGDAQNVNDDNGRPMTGEELELARNKANEGIKQGEEQKLIRKSTGMFVAAEANYLLTRCFVN